MAKLAIIGTIEVAPGRRDQVLPLLMAHRRRCLEDEPGTLAFEVLVPNDDASKILLYELYEDAAAFQAHWNGPSTTRVREEAGSMIVKIYGTQCALSE
jgi:autoinducer 2-degrading protein